ncbi:type II toxin-antitoxin system RelE/ParE family toxin [Thermithiobacillus plumbiphilus]|uniref:Type II toxin-antitoxin system RelE/ParE family toxin n=1 Tax=Thermithiobacillus plumbiphilus TaxID=1729899 RepID=A0ABU9DCW1_9PROT
MMGSQVTIHVTRNLETNLEQIRTFLLEKDLPKRFDHLLDLLFEQLVPNLERFPRMGRDFLAHEPLSVEGLARLRGLVASFPVDEIREYPFDDYLLLYALRGHDLYLLSLKHHRQLSFDFQAFWR